jgi:hypothetical protein
VPPNRSHVVHKHGLARAREPVRHQRSSGPDPTLVAEPARVPLSPARVLQLQALAGNQAVCRLVQPAGPRRSLVVQRSVGSLAYRAAKALGKRLVRSAGVRGSQLLYKSAARRALRRLESFGIDKAVAVHIADHFTMIPEKVAHSVFEASLRSTKAVTALVRETLKKGASAPILSKTDSGALAWVFEAELGRTIGTAGKQALSKLRVVVDFEGRLITAFPIRTFTTAVTLRGLGGIRVTLQSALVVLAVQGAYESEAEAAMESRRRFDEENEPSWWEYLIPWGPSSTIGFEVTPALVDRRSAKLTEELEAIMGEPLAPGVSRELREDVRGIWSTAPGD